MQCVVARHGKVQMVQGCAGHRRASRQICSEPNRLQRSAKQIVPAKVKQCDTVVTVGPICEANSDSLNDLNISEYI